MCLISSINIVSTTIDKRLLKIWIKKRTTLSLIYSAIRLLRHSIIHHKSIALKEAEKCKVMKRFKKDDIIIIDETKIKMLIQEISVYLELLKPENA